MCAEFSIHKDRTLPRVGMFFVVITLLPLVVHCNSPESDPWPIDYGDEALLTGGLSNFDFVVIGGSWAGSVVAKRLSENPEWKILVLEQSGNVTFSAEPSAGSCLAKVNLTCRWPRDNTASKPVRYVRGHPADYNNWKDHGNYGWNWKNVVPDFDKSVSRSGNKFTPEAYVTLNGAKPLSRNLRSVQRFITDSRQNLQRYQSFAHSYNFSMPIISMRDSEEIRRRSNLYVIKNAEVKRINLDSSRNRAKSVTFVLRNNQELEVEVTKEVVLSAGTIDSAKILMLSGIGKPNHLETLQIPVVHDLPVGQNLQDHLALPLFLLMPALDVQPLQQEKGNQNDWIIQNGELPLTEFFDTTSQLESPDIGYNYFYIKQNDLAGLNKWSSALCLSEFYEKNLQYKLATYNLLIVNAILTHPKSLGSVELRSAKYTDALKIITNYLNSSEDVKTMLRGVRLMQLKVNLYPHIEGIRLWEMPIPECNQHRENSDDYWRCYFKHLTTSTLDHVGTIRMGVEVASSCVDPRLFLHGVQNLRVADASIMPSIPMAETTATTIMIAEKAAKFIKRDWPSRKLLFQLYNCHTLWKHPEVCNTPNNRK